MYPLLRSATFILIYSQLVGAQSRFPCSDPTFSSSCQQYQLPGITPLNSSCNAVPATNSSDLSTKFACGYQNANCDRDANCDGGRCYKENGPKTQGVCFGGFNQACNQQDSFRDCLGILSCGSSTCGGLSAICTTDGITPRSEACLSNNCDSTSLRCIEAASSSTSANLLLDRAAVALIASPVKTVTVTMTVMATCTSAPTLTPPPIPSNRLSGRDHFTKDCPSGFKACPVGGLGSKRRSYTCVDTMNTLESCGGCPGVGKDCSEINMNGVDSVQCSFGRCVAMCQSGYEREQSGGTCQPI